MAGNAAIYIADPSLMGSRFFDKIEGIQSYEGLSQGDSATGVRFILDAGQVTIIPFTKLRSLADRAAPPQAGRSGGSLQRPG